MYKNKFVVAFLALFSLGKATMKNYEIITNNSDYFIIKINPKAIEARIIINGKDPISVSLNSGKTKLAINANFYYKPPLLPITPIGNIFDSTKKISTFMTSKTKERPCFSITKDGNAHIINEDMLAMFKPISKIIIQAGPWLVKDFKIITKTEWKDKEKFRDDVIRKTDHVALGVLSSGKMIVMYAKNKPLVEMASTFTSLGCKNAMKLDGGSAAALRFDKINLGRVDTIPVALELVF